MSYFLTGLNPIRTIGDFANHSSYKGLVDDIMMWLEFEDGMKNGWYLNDNRGTIQGFICE